MADAAKRRSSRPRSSSAFVGGDPAPPAFNPTDAAWGEIEAPYRPFNGEERNRLRAIVDEYLDWHRFELAANLVDDRVSEIDAVLGAAQNLNKALSRLTGAADDARLDAMLAIEQAWPGYDGLIGNTAGDRLGPVLAQTAALALACVKAKTASAGQEPGIRIGDAWDGMVFNLAVFIKGCSLKVSASKGSASEPSPFVVFVRTIEDHCPQGVPRGSSTDSGLSSAISKAIKTGKISSP